MSERFDIIVLGLNSRKSGEQMPVSFAPVIDEEGRIECFLDGESLPNTPEERVRQRYLRILHYDYGYPKAVMSREVPIYRGHRELTDREGKPIRADIMVYQDARACSRRDQGRVLLVVECKAPNQEEGHNQLVSYIYNTSASGGVWFNGSGDENEVAYYRRLSEPSNILEAWPGIPRHKETWDAVGRQTKAQLRAPRDVKGLLRRCHSRLYARGADTDEEDLTMDMVRIILAKATDEESEEQLPQFYCTPDEYRSETGRTAVADRVQALFDQVKGLNPNVFDPHERVTLSPRAICDVVAELQPYQILSSLSSAEHWDLMGQAYEEYTATYLKRKRRPILYEPPRDQLPRQSP